MNAQTNSNSHFTFPWSSSCLINMYQGIKAANANPETMSFSSYSEHIEDISRLERLVYQAIIASGISATDIRKPEVHGKGLLTPNLVSLALEEIDKQLSMLIKWELDSDNY